MIPMIHYFMLGFCFEQLMTSCLATEEIVSLSDGRKVFLSTRGPSAFRIRFVQGAGFESPMIQPSGQDATYWKVNKNGNVGISATFGSLLVSAKGGVVLHDCNGNVLTRLTPSSKLSAVNLTTHDGKLYGRGAGEMDSRAMNSGHSTTSMTNTETYVPHYYSSDGYAALGVVKDTVYAKPRLSAEPRGALPVNWTSDGRSIMWTYKGVFELYLMPAADLKTGTVAYFDLIGRPRMPPRYVFGFLASRWGWKNKAYVEDVVKRFREDRFPLDAVIFDFEFFSRTPD